MSRVALSKEMLKWAIDRRGYSLAKLRKRIPQIDSWLEGKTVPTLKQLEVFAQVTSTPFGFLFLDKPPIENLPIPHFRTLKDSELSGPSPELVDTIRVMQQRQAWYRDYLLELDEEPLEIVAAVTTKSKAVDVARKLREYLNLPDGWASRESTWADALKVLRESIEKAGILVFVNGIVGNNTHRKIDVDEFRGFVLVDKYAPLVFVNGSDGKAAQMFTLAHELAHVILGASAAFDLRDMQAAPDPTEQLCNEIAAEFLVGERELRSFWSQLKMGADRFQAVARFFKVSAIVAARRALDLGLISRKTFFDYWNGYLREEKRLSDNRAPGGDFYAVQNLRVGKRFGEKVVQAISEGKLLYSEAYRLTGLYGEAFEKFAVEQGYKEQLK